MMFIFFLSLILVVAGGVFSGHGYQFGGWYVFAAAFCQLTGGALLALSLWGK